MIDRFLKNSARRLFLLTLGTTNPHPPMRNWYQYYFDRYKRERSMQRPGSLTGFVPPFEKGLVSIVLPVFNGERHLSEAMESILTQSYSGLELIVVNDGSTDTSPSIMESYAAMDKRVRVIHQENQRLPRSLSRGFRSARGEYLTWTSDDNRLKPNCIERLVSCLERHPDWDMVYANMDIIGEDGEPLRGSEWYSNYQVPPGSEHVYLPDDPAELNVWPNQYIGAAFMYRARVAALLRDYSPFRFTIEDYDYFMQINEFFTIRHADFKEPVYEYRFHSSSLTSREKELQILKQREFLMVFDDFRRDFNLTPLMWIIEEDGETNRETAEAIASLARNSGDLVEPRGRWPAQQLPQLWFPSCYVRVTENSSVALERPADGLPAHCATILVHTGRDTLQDNAHAAWDLLIHTGRQPTIGTRHPFQGWHRVQNHEDIFLAAEIRSRKKQFEAIEKEIFEPGPPALKYSVVICTYKRTHLLEKAIKSVAKQDFPKRDYEIIIVDNDPAGNLAPLIDDIKQSQTSGGYADIRMVICPLKGLSHARNAGISRARGEVVCFLDDDAIAEPDWLTEIHRAYESRSDAGVVGGKILVQAPEKRPEWLEDQALVYWSHFDPPMEDITFTDNWWEFPWGANWTARKRVLVESGGFRCRYGRKGNDFGGGEELLAGCIVHRLGYKVGVNPRARVLHLIEPSRFTRRHVKKTIRAALLVNYRLQTDLYMPRWMNGPEVAKKTGGWIRDISRYFMLSPFERLKVRSNLNAHLSLLKLIVHDYRMRARKQAK